MPSSQDLGAADTYRTKDGLADLCGFHRSFMIAVEKGRPNASTLTLLRLARALSVLPSDLFGAFNSKVMKSLDEDVQPAERG